MAFTSRMFRFFRRRENDEMPSPLVLRCGAVSITGNYRSNNEDRCLVDGQSRFVLVADGMGGQSAGEKASELAVDIVSRKVLQLIDFDKAGELDVNAGIGKSVLEANSEIMALGELEPQFHNMGTTLAFLLAARSRIYAGGVGDSRVYHLRDGQIRQLTKDHSIVQALLDAGTISPEDAQTHRYRNVLYKYLGTKEGSQGVDVVAINPKQGDRFLVCSDGVTDGLPAEKVAELLGSGDDPKAVAQGIVEAAQAGGSKDNITAVVVFC